jgi:hypothetical protein
MFTVIPIIQHPSYDYKDLARAIMRMGANPQHTLATIALQSNDDMAYEFADTLADFYGKNVKITLADEPGTPTAFANRLFNAAIKAFQKAGGDKFPMLYFPPNCRPTAQFWLDNLQSNYFRSGAPEVFGKIESGPIILSMKYVTTSTLRHFLPTNTHWRKFMADEMRSRNVPEAEGIITNLIQ